MILKEAFQYMNYLDRMVESGYSYIKDREFVTSTEQRHIKSKADKEAINEVIVVPKPYNVSFMPMAVIDMISEIIRERETLSQVIYSVKKKSDFDIDQAISINKKKQDFIRYLTRMSLIKPSNEMTSGTGYKFNVNGDQTAYKYDIEEVTTIDFDRKAIKSIIKKLTDQTEAVSKEHDRFMILTEVDFTPKWNMTDSLEDILEAKGETVAIN